MGYKCVVDGEPLSPGRSRPTPGQLQSGARHRLDQQGQESTPTTTEGSLGRIVRERIGSGTSGQQPGEGLGAGRLLRFVSGGGSLSGGGRMCKTMC